MPRTKFSSRIRIAFLNIMQAIGAAASHWASNAKLRVQEINLESRRHEILTEASLQAFELWHSGVKLPKKLSDMFTELSAIDDKLSVLRAQKYAKVKSENEELPEDNEDLPEDSEHAIPEEIDAEALVCTPAPPQVAAETTPRKAAAKKKPGKPKPEA